MLWVIEHACLEGGCVLSEAVDTVVASQVQARGELGLSSGRKRRLIAAAESTESAA